jgi:predicted permease
MRWFHRLFNIFRSDAVDRDIDREMAFHLAERTDDLVAGGMPTAAARHEARRRFGNVGTQKERTRERDLVAALDTLVADIRYAGRALRAAPGFAAVAILSLALGIGANTAIFTLVNAVLLRSLPVSHPEQLVLVTRGGAGIFTNPLWEALRDRQDVFSGAAAYASTEFTLSTSGEVRRVTGNWVSGDFFSMLGLQPVAGRLLSRSDDYRGCPPVAVISAGFWQSNYGGRADVVGQTVSVNGRPFPIAGVVDPRFFGVEVGDHVNIFAPLCAEAVIRGSNATLDARSNWWIRVLARPKAGLSTEQVAARLAALSPGIAEATLPPNAPPMVADSYLHATLGIGEGSSGFSMLRRQYQKALWVLMAGVGVVLLIACANVANLLLARAKTREREMAVRLALGAGRGRLVRQLLTESVSLSLLGAAVGALFAYWGTRLLVELMSTSGHPLVIDLGIDTRVLVFTMLLAVATGILFGLVPAWRARAVDPQVAMKSHARGVADGHTRFTLGKALVVAQVALSLVLVAGAGLLVGSWRRLATVDPGFRSDGVVVATASISRTAASVEQRAALFQQMLERLGATPGVVSVATARVTPMGDDSWNDVIQVAGFFPKSELDALVWMNEVSPGYFGTMGTPLIAGRDFSAVDVPTSPTVAIVTESLARHFFGAVDVVGRQFRIQKGREYGPPVEIIGVVKDSKYGSMRDEHQSIAYLAQTQSAATRGSTTFIVRTRGDVGAGVSAVRSILGEVAPGAALELRTLDSQIAESIRLPRTLATLSGFFGALALLLATIGLYGIMSYSVARRRNEIGVRIALGAARGRVVRMVLGETGVMVLIGVALGVALSLATMKLVASFLYGVAPADRINLAATAIVLAIVGMGAALLPAARAARLDPVAALRED